MKALALALLVSFVAHAADVADDAPRMIHVAPGYVVTEASWVLNEPGKARLDKAIQDDRQKLAQLDSDKTALGAQPALTWRGGLLLVGGGVVLGIVVTSVIFAVAKR